MNQEIIKLQYKIEKEEQVEDEEWLEALLSDMIVLERDKMEV